MSARAVLIALLGGVFAAPALALDYMSLSEPAAMYDAPSQKAKPLYAIAAGTPVEVVVSLAAWVKVRDSKGDLAWVERRLLASKRTVLVRTERAQVRTQSDEAAALVFEAEKDAILEWIEPGPLGWVKVRHRDGQGGFIKAVQVWGL
jgi:SH3-like domain-containing protein